MLTRNDFHAYQEEAVEHCHIHPFSGEWLDAGLGKTVSLLTYTADLIETGELRIDRGEKALVVAPIRVATQTWPNEIPEWEHLRHLEYQLIRAEDKDPEVRHELDRVYRGARDGLLTREESRRYQEAVVAYLDKRMSAVRTLYNDGIPTPATLDDEMMIYEAARELAGSSRFEGIAVKEAVRASGVNVTAFKEQLRRRQALSPVPLHFIDREHIGWLVDYRRELRKGWPYKLVIYDESSDLGDRSTGRWKALSAIRGELRFFKQLTATPAAESYLKIFAQVFLLDLGERLGRSITAYRQKHFTYIEKKMEYKLRPGHDKIISSKISDICLVMKAKDHLPEIETTWIDLPRRIELDDDVKALQQEFIRKGMMEVQGQFDRETVMADTPASLSSKLMQFASGCVYAEGKRPVIVHDEKIEELRQLADELHGEPLFVVYWWQSSLQRLRKSFPKAVVMDRAGSQQNDWNKGKIPMLLVHPQGSEFGLNLQKGPGHDVVPFDMFWSYEKWYQIHKRLARQGQKQFVRSWPLMVKNSADEVCAERLREKEDAQEALFQWIMSFRRAANMS